MDFPLFGAHLGINELFWCAISFPEDSGREWGRSKNQVGPNISKPLGYTIGLCDSPRNRVLVCHSRKPHRFPELALHLVDRHEFGRLLVRVFLLEERAI